jgi:hypothetical protein
VISSPFKTPGTEVPILCYSATCPPLYPWGPTLTRRLGISRIVNPQYKVALLLETPNAETPIRRIRATCPRSNRRFRLNREIATRDFDVHATFALVKPDMPMRDGKWVPLALENSSGSRDSILFTLFLGLFPQCLQGTIPPELCFSGSFRDLSNTLLVLDLQPLSTVLKSSRSGAFTVATNPAFPSSDLLLRLHVRPALACTVRITQFTLGKTRTKVQLLASSTHSMRRNSTALYAGISWLKQRNN